MPDNEEIIEVEENEEEPIVDPSWSDEPEPDEHAKFKDLYEIDLGNDECSYCILSSFNDVIFLENFELDNYTANNTVGTLPSDCVPSTNIYLPCVISETSTAITILKIDTNGNLSIPSSHSSAILHTLGLTFNICANYFNKED